MYKYTLTLMRSTLLSSKGHQALSGRAQGRAFPTSGKTIAESMCTVRDIVLHALDKPNLHAQKP